MSVSDGVAGLRSSTELADYEDSSDADVYKPAPMECSGWKSVLPRFLGMRKAIVGLPGHVEQNRRLIFFKTNDQGGGNSRVHLDRQGRDAGFFRKKPSTSVW